MSFFWISLKARRGKALDWTARGVYPHAPSWANGRESGRRLDIVVTPRLGPQAGISRDDCM
jgi:hypothetical protein